MLQLLIFVMIIQNYNTFWMDWWLEISYSQNIQYINILYHSWIRKLFYSISM